VQNLLITGGAGFIGSNFIHYLLGVDANVRVVNLDALTYSGSLENLKGLPNSDRYNFVKGDICDSELVARLLHEFQIDGIVHFAAESHVDRSISGPGQFVRTNILGTYTLLQSAREYWLRNSAGAGTYRFHHVSTDEVFGSLDPEGSAWTEESPYDPHSPYAASKASGDHLVRAYGHTYGLPYTLTNCTNNYGPYQFPEKLIPLMVLNALEGKPLPVYGDGQQIRDWLHVEDHCQAIYLILRQGLPGSSYNIGGGNQPTNLAIVEMICDLMDDLAPNPMFRPYRQLIQFVKDRPGHDRRYALNTRKIEQELGWQPRHTLQQGLHDTLVWYLAHPEWVTSIRRQKEYQDWMEKNYSGR
jgi:dTDP-glucose 4,6-dehydratase